MITFLLAMIMDFRLIKKKTTGWILKHQVPFCCCCCLGFCFFFGPWSSNHQNILLPHWPPKTHRGFPHERWRVGWVRGTKAGRKRGCQQSCFFTALMWRANHFLLSGAHVKQSGAFSSRQKPNPKMRGLSFLASQRGNPVLPKTAWFGKVCRVFAHLQTATCAKIHLFRGRKEIISPLFIV